MPPYKCSVEITPQEQFDPMSIDWTRRMRSSGIEGTERCSDLKFARVITFVLGASDLEAAQSRVDDMCDTFLINKVYEQATVTVTEIEDSSD